MKKTLFVLSLIVSLIPATLDAQSMSNKERRHLNTMILNVIEEYERYATIYDEEAQYCFLDLFVSDDAPVFCDMIGYPSYLRQVPVSEYVGMMRSVTSTASIVISDIRKEEMNHTSRGWVIPVSFRKNISYMDENGCAFSIAGYYGKDVDLSMTLVYDQDKNRCKIESITGTIDSDRKFPEGRFMIVTKPDESKLTSRDARYMNEMTFGGGQLTYNEFGQSILEPQMPEVNDVDVIVLPDTLARGLNYDIIGFNFKHRKSRLKARYAIAPFGAYDVLTSAGVASKSSAMEFGLDLGVTFSSGRKAKTGFYIGAGISSGNLALSLVSPLTYAYYTSLPGSQDLYKKLLLDFNIKSASENLKFTDIVVPLYFETEYIVGNYVLISWNVGMKAYCNAKTTGVYALDGQVSLTDEIDGKTTEKIHISSNMYMNPVSYKRTPLELTAIANLGVDVNVLKKRLYVSLRGGYEYGLMKSYYGTGLKFFDAEKNIYPVVYNPLTSGYTAMHSFISNTSYRRQAFWLEFGLKLKM